MLCLVAKRLLHLPSNLGVSVRHQVETYKKPRNKNTFKTSENVCWLGVLSLGTFFRILYITQWKENRFFYKLISQISNLKLIKQFEVYNNKIKLVYISHQTVDCKTTKMDTWWNIQTNWSFLCYYLYLVHKTLPRHLSFLQLLLNHHKKLWNKNRFHLARLK